MNKTAKVITSFAVLILLTSCQRGGIRNINDVTASKLAKEILARQKKDTFSLPNKFSIKTSTRQKIDANLKSNEIVYNISIDSENECDLDNLIFRTYRKKTYEVPSAGSSEKETITYYDESKSLLYTVNIIDKGKNITSTSMNKDEAIKEITKFRDSYKLDMCETSLYILTNFDSNLESYKSFYKKVKDKIGSYFIYSFKSSGSNSLEHSNELKIKQEKTYGEDKMSGYITGATSYVIKNDLLNYISFTGSSNLKTSDKVYYNKQTTSNITSYNYIDVKIDRPIIE